MTSSRLSSNLGTSVSARMPATRVCPWCMIWFWTSCRTLHWTAGILRRSSWSHGWRADRSPVSALTLCKHLAGAWLFW
jgi:hypothetical protein